MNQCLDLKISTDVYVINKFEMEQAKVIESFAVKTFL